MQVRVPQQAAKMSVAVYTALALSILSAASVVVPVKEARSGCHLVQTVSGLNALALWPAVFLVDLLVFALSAAAILAVLVFSGLPGLGLGHTAPLAVFLGMYGAASISQVSPWYHSLPCFSALRCFLSHRLARCCYLLSCAFPSAPSRSSGTRKLPDRVCLLGTTSRNGASM